MSINYMPTLSPPQRLPLGIPIKISIIDKNRKRAGNDGKRETAGAAGLSSLFPLPIVPRALSFSFSPASPQHKSLPTIQRGLCGGERCRPQSVLAILHLMEKPIVLAISNFIILSHESREDREQRTFLEFSLSRSLYN